MAIGLSIPLTQYCDDLWREEEVEYGSWGATSTWDFNGNVDIVDKFPDIAVEFDLIAGDTVFVVWAQWSTGDSFGYHHGAYAEVFGVFKSIDRANEFKEYLESAAESIAGGNCQPAEFKSKDGQKFSIYMPWWGYFESLDYVSVDRAVVADMREPKAPL